MAWFWLRVRISMRLGAQDTWQTQGVRLITGLMVAVVATILAIIASRQPSALLTIFAYPIVVGLIWGFFVVRRFFGWNRLWRRECRITLIPEGRHINLWLHFRGPVGLLLGVEMDVSCNLRDPAGREIEVTNVNLFRGQFYGSYFEPRDGASPLVPGTYWVLWKDRKVPGSGRWRVFDACRFTLPALAAAEPANESSGETG